MRSNTRACSLVLGWTVVVATSIGGRPLPVDGQVAPVVEGARTIVRAVIWGRDVLATYAVGKGLDRLLGEGADVQAELGVLEDRLSIEAAANTANRTILLRQAALVAELKETVSRLESGDRPSTAALDSVSGDLERALEGLRRIQEDHGRRIGRLEESVDSLRSILERSQGDRVRSAEAATVVDSDPVVEAPRRLDLGEPLSTTPTCRPYAPCMNALRVEVTTVEHTRTGLELGLLLTNLGVRSTAARFYARGDEDCHIACTYLVDDRGRRYSPIPGGIFRGRSQASVNTVPNVPVRVVLAFEPVEEVARTATLVMDGIVYLGGAVLRAIPLR